MPPKAKKKTFDKRPKNKAVAKGTGASSTRVETAVGSHVTTVVSSSVASAEPPIVTAPLLHSAAAEDTRSASASSLPPSDWLEHGRHCWEEGAPQSERRVVVSYSSYSTEFECRGPWGCVRWGNIDDEYALSFVFEGSFEPNVRCFPAGTNSSSNAADTPVSFSLKSHHAFILP